MEWMNNINLAGKIVVVTGGNSGIGFENCRSLALFGATVIMASRSIDKAIAAKKEIEKSNPKGTIEIMQLDLGVKESITNFATEFNRTYEKLDILINNAGIMVTPYHLTELGIESQLAINHLGHFYLTHLLMNKLKKSDSARIVNVSSIAHKKAELNIEDINYSNGESYTPMVAYRRSKLANLLFTFELSKRLSAAKSNIVVAAAHPGISRTDLANKKENKRLYKMIVKLGMKLIAQSSSDGALATLRAAVDPKVKTGDFYGPNSKNERKGNPVKVTPNKNATNETLMNDLFEFSESVFNIKFNI